MRPDLSERIGPCARNPTFPEAEAARAQLIENLCALPPIMSALVKAVSDTIPPGESVFFRSLFAIPVILVTSQ